MKSEINQGQRALIYVNIIITSIASSMLITALTTALPALVNDLDISYATGQWITSGYSLVMGVMTPLTAYLITRFPTKKLYLTGIGISIIGLFLCVIAPNFQMVMFARGLQACGNGITASMGQVVLLSIYPVEKRGAIMGGFGLATGAAPVIAPTLAGIIIDSWGWRAIFFVVFIVLVASFIWAIFSFGNVLETQKKTFDSKSFILSAITFCGLTLGIGNIVSYGFSSVWVWPLLTSGLIAAAIFVHRQAILAHPFLEIKVFQDRNYAISVLGSMLQHFVVMGLTVILPVFIQSVCGYSATLSGIIRLPGSLAMAVTSLMAGKVYDKIGIKKLFVIGPCFLFISLIGAAFFHPMTPAWLVASVYVVNNIAIGILLMPIVTWGLQGLNSQLTAHGSAISNSLKTVAGSIGSSVSVGIMTVINSSSAGVNSTLGFRTACILMAFLSVGLLMIGIFFVPSRAKSAN